MSRESWTADSADRVVKGYLLRELIGVGSSGTVYRAYQPVMAREVALKHIGSLQANHPDFARHFDIEAQRIARLEHPHIVPLYDYWRGPDGAYLVMRWLLGGNLRGKVWSLEALVRLLTQITAALTAAHRQNITHGNLKPENILLDDDRNAYLTDFVIAPMPSLADGAGPSYHSPEQSRGERATPQSDVYSLGLVLYELLTGEAAIPRVPMDVSSSVTWPALSTRRPDLSSVLDRVLQKATDPDPDHRYVDVETFTAAFCESAGIESGAGHLPGSDELTPREREILQLIAEGLSNREIGQRLIFSVDTIKWYLKQIYSKLGVHSRLQAVERARDLNLLGTAAGALSSRGPSSANRVVPGQGMAGPGNITTALENPYKGLRAFQIADAPDFFGCEALVSHLLSRLAGSELSGHFLAVVGPSGSGKSSVVRAGLVPALWHGALPGSAEWFFADMLPGTHPLEELEIALLRIAVNPPPSLLSQLREDRRGLLRATRRILPDDQSELLLIIDQFEEVFTLVDDEAERTYFLDSLYTAITDPHSRVRVLITLRADFYDRPLQYPGLAELIEQHTQVIVPLRPDELEQAITGPARRVGLQLEPGLVVAILAELHGQPGSLPLLQYTLTELFEQREGALLTLSAYRAVGGVLAALARRANALYTELDEQGQLLIRQLFLRLVTLGEGIEDTRRRVLLSELQFVGAGTDRVEELINLFGRYRLLTLDRDPVTGGPTVEIAHEALIQGWGRLHEWIDKSREHLRIQRQLRAAAADWINTGHDASYLVSGTRLAQFTGLTDESDLALNHDERAYLDASIAEREHQAMEERKRQAREKALEHRSRNFLRVLLAVLLIAALVGFGLATVAFNAQSTAQKERDRAQTSANESLSLALASGAREAVLKNNPDLGLALAVEANIIPQASAQAAGTLADLALAPGTRRIFSGHSSPVMAVAISPDGRYLLTGSGQLSLFLQVLEDNSMRLWDLQTGQEIRRFEGHTSAVWSVVFSPDGRTAFAGSADRTVIQWDLATGAVLNRYESPDIPGGVNAVVRLALSADGKSLLIATYDGKIRLIDIETGKERQIFRLHIPWDLIYYLSFSPDGQIVYSVGMVPGSSLENLVIWDVASGTERHFEIGDSSVLSGFRAGPADIAAAVSPDGRRAMSVRGSNLVLYDVATGQEIRHFDKAHSGHISSITFSPDGRTALTTADDASLILWNLETGQPIRSFHGRQGMIDAAAFAPDGLRAVSGSSDGTARLWDLDGGCETSRLTAAGYDQMWGLAVSPDGHTALAAALDTTSQSSLVIEWDSATGAIIHRFEGHRGAIRDIAYSPDGQTALIAGDDDLISLLDLRTGLEVRRYPFTRLSSVAFTPDGQTAIVTTNGKNASNLVIATGAVTARYGPGGPPMNDLYSNGRILLTPIETRGLGIFDTETGQQTGLLEVQQVIARAAAVSSDGRYALSGGGDPFLILWDLGQHTEIRRFTLPTPAIVNTLAFSPDSQLALSGLSDGLVLLWDVSSGRLLARFEGHYGEVWRVRFSPDGRAAFSTGRDGTLRRWVLPPRSPADWLAWTFASRYVRDLTSAEQDFYSLSGFRTIVDLRAGYVSMPSVVTFPTLGSTSTPLPAPVLASANAQTAQVGGNRGQIAPGGQQRWTFAGPPGQQLIFQALADHPTTGVYDWSQQVAQKLLDTSITIHGPDGIVLGENDDFLGALDNDARVDLTLRKAGLYQIEVSSAQHRTGGDYTLKITPVLAGVEHARYTYEKGGYPGAISFSPDGRKLVAAAMVAGTDGVTIPHLTAWDIGDTAHPLTQTCDHPMGPDEPTDEIMNIRYSPDGQSAISADFAGRLFLWDANRCQKVAGPYIGHHLVVLSTAFTPDGRMVLSGSYDGTARLWNVQTAAEIWYLDTGFFVDAVAILPDGKTALLASTAGTITLLDLKTRRTLRTLSTPDVPYSMALSPDGQVIAVGARSGDIFLWNLTSGQQTGRLRGHASPAMRVVFSSDGRYLLSGSTDHTVRLWNVATGSELVRFHHDNMVNDVAISPDGHTVASTSYDGTLRLWTVPELPGG